MSISFDEITSITKQKTARLFSNAISITTIDKEVSYKFIININIIDNCSHYVPFIVTVVFPDIIHAPEQCVSSVTACVEIFNERNCK